MSMTPSLQPLWWSDALAQSVEQEAQAAAPNEVCGLLYSLPGGPAALHCFAGTASPKTCEAAPDEVVVFAYELVESGGRALATFHSHPGGESHPSQRDMALQDWTHVHLLLYFSNGQWQQTWWTTEDD